MHIPKTYTGLVLSTSIQQIANEDSFYSVSFFLFNLIKHWLKYDYRSLKISHMLSIILSWDRRVILLFNLVIWLYVHVTLLTKCRTCNQFAHVSPNYIWFLRSSVTSNLTNWHYCHKYIYHDVLNKLFKKEFPPPWCNIKYMLKYADSTSYNMLT